MDRAVIISIIITMPKSFAKKGNGSEIRDRRPAATRGERDSRQRRRGRRHKIRLSGHAWVVYEGIAPSRKKSDAGERFPLEREREREEGGWPLSSHHLAVFFFFIQAFCHHFERKIMRCGRKEQPEGRKERKKERKKERTI
jgi:hypothetical protein